MKYIIHLLLALTLSLQALEAMAIAPLGCLIEPSQIAQVGSQVVGVTESINVERGDAVQKGQILAILQSAYEQANLNIAQTRSKLEAEVRSARANLQLARITEKRGLDLLEKKFLSQQALDKSHAETQLAEQRLEQAKDQLRIATGELSVARAQLGLRSIRAPFDGIVAERFIWPGERVEDKPLFKIVKVNPLRVEIVAPVELYGQVEKSQIIQIKPELANAGTLDAKVILVDQVIDGASNTFRIRAEIDNEKGKIPSGLRCKALLNEKNSKQVAKVTDSPTKPDSSKHSFALKPLDQSSSAKQEAMITRPFSLDINKNKTSSSQLLEPAQTFLWQQFSLPMDNKSENTSFTKESASRIPMESSVFSSPYSIKEQLKQLQSKLETKSTKQYITLPFKAEVIVQSATPAITQPIAYHFYHQLKNTAKNVAVYPSAFVTSWVRRVAPLSDEERVITHRDADKTFPIRRVFHYRR